MEYELILNFHGVGVPHRHVGADERAVWISRDGFVAWLDRIAAWRSLRDIPIAITFDDGNASDVTIALPELRKRDLTATFFVCAGRLDKPEYVDRSALRELLQAGMRVGSHGMHHQDWRTLKEDALAEEVVMARKRLEGACGNPVDTAAVPFGSYDRRVLSQLRRAGYTCVYTSDRGLASRGAWLKPRNTLREGSHPEDLMRLLTGTRGLDSFIRSAHRLLKGLR